MKCKHETIAYNEDLGRLECIDCGKPRYKIIKDEEQHESI